MQDPIDVKAGDDPDYSEGAEAERLADPDTTLEGDAFVQADDAEPEELTLTPVDVFAVDVQFAQDRAYGPSPMFDTYDEARAVGVDLLKNHADARSFSVRKSTILR